EKTRNRLKAKVEELRTLKKEVDEKCGQYEELVQDAQQQNEGLRKELDNMNQINAEACREKEEVNRQLDRANEEKEATYAKHEADKLILQNANDNGKSKSDVIYEQKTTSLFT